MILSPGSGFFTVRVPVTVMTPPTGMFPVQVMAVALSTSVPELAVWSPLGMASSMVPALRLEMVIPV